VKLVNLSTKGGSIEFEAIDKVPRKKSEFKIEFSFPGSSERLCVNAKVVWTKEKKKNDESHFAIIGVTFIDIDETTHSCIWNYLLDHSPAPVQ
jgi:Tfp pilus assembly protein PilZ